MQEYHVAFVSAPRLPCSQIICSWSESQLLSFASAGLLLVGEPYAQHHLLDLLLVLQDVRLHCGYLVQLLSEEHDN